MEMETVVNSLQELDVLVAEKVMGVANLDQWRINYRLDATGHYSTRIETAWQVVERFYSASIERLSNGQEYSAYLVTAKGEFNVDGMATAATAPIAICLAALKTVGIEAQLADPIL